MQTGYANVLYLLTAQVAYEGAVIQLVQAQAARVSDVAALHLALGGGWSNRSGPPAPEQKFDVATGQAQPVAPASDPVTDFFRILGAADGPIIK